MSADRPIDGTGHGFCQSQQYESSGPEYDLLFRSRIRRRVGATFGTQNEECTIHRGSASYRIE